MGIVTCDMFGMPVDKFYVDLYSGGGIGTKNVPWSEKVCIYLIVSPEGTTTKGHGPWQKSP